MRSFILALIVTLYPFAVFAQEPEPEIPGAQSIQGSSGTIQSGVIHPDQPQGPALPDLPLETLPSETLSVQFLVEHRSALHEKKVTVRGTVLSVLVGEDACPSSGGMCAQPRLTLADSEAADRDNRYDLVVLFPEGGGEGFRAGEVSEISGTVSASAYAAVVRAE